MMLTFLEFHHMKLRSLLHKGFLYDSLALLAGAVLTLAFAPFKAFPIAILSPALLLTTWLHATPKKAFWRGFLFGFGFFLTGVYWIFISIHTYGETPAWLAAFIMLGMVAILSLYPAFNGYLLNRYFPINNESKILLAFPLLWVFLEWLRGLLFTGFPWLLLGNSQVHSPLKGFAPVFGVFGVSLAVTALSALLVNSYLLHKKHLYKKLGINIALFALIWLIGGVLTFIPWTKPEGKPIKVSLVQGNIEQQLKWSPEQVQPTLDTYEKLTKQHWDSRIIIWPESAIPLPFINAAEFLFKLDALARQNNTSIILGIPVGIPGTRDYLNSVITLGTGRGIYAKHRLVPFGEHVPFRDYLGKLLQFMDIPMSDFVAGKDHPEPIVVDNIKIGTFICYEIAYPEQVLFRDGDTNILLTVSNDGWFGKSIAQAQHLEIAQMRALEMGRPVLFVSNNGITAIIKPDGNIQKSIPPFEENVLTDEVQPMEGKTPWDQRGMDGVLVVMLTMFFYAVRKRKEQK